MAPESASSSDWSWVESSESWCCFLLPDTLELDSLSFFDSLLLFSELDLCLFFEDFSEGGDWLLCDDLLELLLLPDVEGTAASTCFFLDFSSFCGDSREWLCSFLEPSSFLFFFRCLLCLPSSSWSYKLAASSSSGSTSPSWAAASSSFSSDSLFSSSAATMAFHLLTRLRASSPTCPSVFLIPFTVLPMPVSCRCWTPIGSLDNLFKQCKRTYNKYTCF